MDSDDKKKIADLEERVAYLENALFVVKRKLFGFPYVGDSVYMISGFHIGSIGYEANIEFIQSLSETKYNSPSFQEVVRKGLCFKTEQEAKKYADNLKNKINKI